MSQAGQRVVMQNTSYTCSVCGQPFASRSASPRHRCKGEHAGRFGVALRDTQPTDTPPVSIPVSRNTQPTAPEPVEGDVEFFVDEEDDEPEPIGPALGISEDYVEPKKVDKPTTRTTVIKLATYIEALEHGLGMNTLSPKDLQRVKADLAGNAADIHIETAEIVIGAGTSILLSGGLLALIYTRDLLGSDMSALFSMLRPSPPAPPRDEWLED